MSWLLTRDHKRIGILYMISITILFMLGGFFAMLMRLELLTPQGDMFASDTYNKLFTLHGIVMIFFFLIRRFRRCWELHPAADARRERPGVPRINLLSWYLFIIGATGALIVILLGGVDTGWTFYTPYSTSYSHTYVVLTILGAFITGFSSILTGFNSSSRRTRCARRG